MARIVAIVVAVLAAAALVWRPAQPPSVMTVAAASPAAFAARHAVRVSPPPDPVVYVAGAVLHPGVYRMHSGQRADDAVRRAGGFRSDADTGAINLAARLSDGDEVFAPVLGQPTPRAVRARARGRTAKKTSTAVVNVNTASAAELATIPGIGATLAARIVDVRERDGAYASYDELLDVAGMTAARLARAEPYLQL